MTDAVPTDEPPSDLPPASTPSEVSALAAPEATLLAWLVYSVANTLLFAVAGSGASQGIGTRLLTHAYDVAQSLVFGVAMALGALALSRVRSRIVPWLVATVVAGALGALFLREDLDGLAGRLSGGQDSAVAVYGVSAAMGTAVAITAAVARLMARPKLRWLVVAGAVIVMVANYRVLQGDYPALHLLAGVTAGAALSAALVGLRWRPPRRVHRVAFVAAGVVACAAMVVPPPNAVAIALASSWTAAADDQLPRTWLDTHEAPADGMAWSGAASARAPHDPAVTGHAIVIYFSVDSLRADLLEGDGDRFENFARLRDSSTWFTQARSPGTQTAVTLHSMMTGSYYSQQYWTHCFVPEGRGARPLFPCNDDRVRFPSLLVEAGVPTVHYGQAVWCLNKYGLVRGFSEERHFPPKKGEPSTKGKWSNGDVVVDAMIARLQKHGDGPLFMFFHDLDPHAPFDLGAVKTGSHRDRYLSEVDLSDARLGRLRAAVEEAGLADRTIFILTADHGEAFDEHGTSFHGQNLYDEQVRVPLVIHVPSMAARRVDTPVTLMDVGPTILDFFGQPTPKGFLGESLVPLLRGRDVELTRPILAETRLKQMMLIDGHMKVIRDQRRKTREIYDLKKDPNELNNLYDELGEKGEAMVARIDAFFAAHPNPRSGYKPPYRR